jgi:hypothetical protein
MRKKEDVVIQWVVEAAWKMQVGAEFEPALLPEVSVSGA